MRRFGGALLVCAAAVAQVACARQWPSVRGVADERFAGGTLPVARIDVMPIDVAVDAHDGSEIPREELAATFAQATQGALQVGRTRAGYSIGAMMDWQGRFEGYDGKTYTAMAAPELVATADSLALYGTAQATRRGGLLVPYLPARLGTVTGSDATLYVGGWAYAGRDESRGAKIAKGVLIAVAVVAIVALVVVIAKKGGGGSLGRAAGGAAGVVAKTAGRAATVAGRGLFRATHAVARGGLRALDVFGRMNTHLDIYVQSGAEPRQMPRSGRSRIFLEMTLVDNRTGRTLWHARQEFRANPGKDADVVESVLRMMRAIPQRS